MSSVFSASFSSVTNTDPLFKVGSQWRYRYELALNSILSSSSYRPSICPLQSSLWVPKMSNMAIVDTNKLLQFRCLVEKSWPKNLEMCPGGQQEMKEKVLPSFGGSQDHSGSTGATWHRGLTGYVFQRWAEGIMQRWLSLALLSHPCLPFEDEVMDLLPRYTPNLPSKKTHFFPGNSLQIFLKYDSLQLGP